jgi:hypothetical protein
MYRSTFAHLHTDYTPPATLTHAASTSATSRRSGLAGLATRFFGRRPSPAASPCAGVRA